MTFEYAGEQYRITFSHNEIYPLPTDQSVLVRGTRCDFKRGAMPIGLYGNGYSYCHPNDNFCRETGRKLALARALRVHIRPFRTAAWKAYLGKPRGTAQQYFDQLLKAHGLTEKTVAKARQELDRHSRERRAE